jgi:hypothetical protein
MIEYLSYFGTGIFWFSAFLALFLTYHGVTRYGYGRPGVLYVEAGTTKIQLATFFVLLLAAVNAVVWSVSAVVTSLI